MFGKRPGNIQDRKKLELAGAVRRAYARVQGLGPQEREEFQNWVKYILLPICGNREAVVEEILNWAGDGEGDMAFKYNLIRVFEEEREEGKAEGKAEDIVDLLEEVGAVSEELRGRIFAQKDLGILRQWHRLAARCGSPEEFEAHMGMEASVPEEADVLSGVDGNNSGAENSVYQSVYQGNL